MFKQIFLFLFAVLLSTQVFSNTIDSSPRMEEEPNVMVTLKTGTEVFLTLNESLNSDYLAPGNAVDFFVRSNVTVNGKVVIAAGATANGWVKKMHKSCNGQCMEITITVESAQAVDGQSVNLRSVPHKISVPCCGNATQADPGVNLRARVLNDVKINA